jgi:1,4-dihydroxy-2-naphthoate polyprenyltransferase
MIPDRTRDQLQERLPVAPRWTATTPQHLALRDVLTGLPRVTPEQWFQASAIVRWLLAIRAPTLTMTLAAVGIGGLLAAADHRVNIVVWLLCALGCGLAHATNNLLNDLTDALRGVDEGNYFRVGYGTHVLAHGLLSRRGLMRYLVGTGIAAAAIGLAVVIAIGPVLWIPFAIGAVILLTYSHPLKQWGLGEISVWLVWGPLLIGGTYLAMAGSAPWPMLVVAAVAGLGPTLVIFGKHTDKLPWDAVRGIRTLPVRIGERASRETMRALVWTPHLGIIVLVAAGSIAPPALLVLAALPRALAMDRICRRSYPDRKPDGLSDGVWPLWFAAHAFLHTRRFALLLIGGLTLGLAS